MADPESDCHARICRYCPCRRSHDGHDDQSQAEKRQQAETDQRPVVDQDPLPSGTAFLLGTGFCVGGLFRHSCPPSYDPKCAQKFAKTENAVVYLNFSLCF